MRSHAILLLALLLAGCLERPGDEANPGGPDAGADGDAAVASMMLSGAFTEAATQADFAEAGGLVEAEGGEMLVLESFPAQFQARGLDADACGRVRAALQAKGYVARVGACEEVRTPTNPEEPTSSGG